MKRESETKMDVENDDIIEYIYIYYLLVLLLNLSWNEELAFLYKNKIRTSQQKQMLMKWQL